jgi:hypothetical protein
MSGDEQVGSVGEEAAKLLEALQGWASGSGAPGFAGGLSDLHEHIATGDRECAYCPLCQAIGLFRQTSPEVRRHLTVAGSSLLQAAAALLETQVPPQRPPTSGVEKIDLDDDPSPGEQGAAGWDAE